jgi:MFS family permease
MTSHRWSILAVLFLARTMMAVQFQSVAALSPLIADTYSVGLADIGFMIGLYFAPGIFFALPGGAIAARFGDKRVVAGGLVLMLGGGIVTATAGTWDMLMFGRLTAGIGGVILNVVMTKMVVDWFAGQEISTAMAVFITSWPVGIALSLAVLPMLASFGGLAVAGWAVCAGVLVALLCFALVYTAPQTVGQAAAALPAPARLPLFALLMASLVWALKNCALAMVFSFGPGFLIQQGWSLTAAGSMISLFMLLFGLALPMGGVMADKTGRKHTIILVSLLSFAVLVPVAVYVPAASFYVFCALGVLFALGAGPTMTLPAEILPPNARAFGMGIFFTVYYVLMMVAPRIGGGLAEASGDAGSALLTGAVMAFLAAVSLVLFRLSSRG